MRLAVIPGDGIGPEVIAEALKVLGEVVPAAEITRYDLGAARWHATGELLPESVLGELRQHDAILLGAVGDPSVPSGILERGLLLRLRFELDHHVNLRPARLYPGVRSPLADPPEIDMVVVREGTEGPYAGNGGLLRKDTPHEIATEVSINTSFGVERVVRDAFARALDPSASASDAGAQDERPHPRRLVVVARGRGGLAAAPRGHRGLPARGRGDDPPGHRPGPVRRDRHRQPVRRHPDRPGRRRHGWHRPGRVGKHGRDPSQPVDVRAGARFGARTSRARASPTRRPPCCRWRCCSTTSASTSRHAASRPPWPLIWLLATTSRPGATYAIGDRLAALVSSNVRTG